MANRYIAGSKLSDREVEALLWGVCSNQSVAQAATAASVSERSAGATMRKLRDRIANSKALLREAGLPTDWPDENDPYWSALYICVFECPSEIREPMEVFGQEAMALMGDRRLCTNCQHKGLMQPRPLLTHTLRHLKTAQRGISAESFKPIFLTTLIYDRFREIELDKALDDPEAMKRFGSTRANHMTMMFYSCKLTLSRTLQQRRLRSQNRGKLK